ncbi:amidase domain-containing protein [candidate division FCPU426 bacterium]|nr:amidase domain-containing protein [candidate division FCPU426 bacterium]
MFALHFSRKHIQTILLLFLIVLFSAPAVYAYNASKAVSYANEWYNRRNTDDYANYSSQGGDCANFVSQCLIDGGMDLSQDERIWSPGVGGTIINCDDLHRHLNEFQHAEINTGTNVNQTPSNLSPGDVVIYGDNNDPYKHAVIVTSGQGSGARIASHSSDVNNVGLSYFLNSSNPNMTFYHFPTATERGHNQEFYGTGRYYGPSTLIFVVLGPSMNYEGYIVDCGDDTEQDLVVGEDTSQYSGCAHYIKGYCSDAHKGIPSRGVTFSQPWTSNDPNHWAYWARRAVQYANQNSYSSRDTLEAIWYITDRSGYYNDILVNIGYSQNGPDKNINGYQGSIENKTIKLINNKFNPMKSEAVSILYNINYAGIVTIKIYTIEGALVKTVLNGIHRSAGTHTETWDGFNDNWGIVASGIYLVHVEGPGLSDTKKLCIIK